MAAQPTLPAMPAGYEAEQWARHTPYSDPGRFSGLVEGVPATDEAASAVARNLIVHYRSEDIELPAGSRQDVNARWVEAILDLDQQRHPDELVAERAAADRVQGCCRDHSLLTTAILRQHGTPARIRYGFAGYFVEDFQVDHVVVETWMPEQHRWRRFDPEVASPMPRLATPRDITVGPDAPFRTAAEVWRAYRCGDLEPNRYGVGPDSEVGGPWYILNAVILDAAFRAGHEVLLWDVWQPMSDPQGPTEQQAELVDRLAELIVAADAGDVDAEVETIRRLREDPQLAPPGIVTTICPWGDPAVRSDLRRRPEPDGHRPTPS